MKLFRNIFSKIMFTVLLLSTLTFATFNQKVNISGSSNAATLAEKHISVAFPIPQIAKIEGYDWFSIENCTYLSTPGQPMLPVESITVKLPERSEVTNVMVEVKETWLQGNFSVLPVPSPSIVGADTSVNYSENPNIYNNTSLFPTEWYAYRHSHGMDAENGNRVEYVVLNLFPLRFLPAKNKVSRAEHVSITIHYVTTEILAPTIKLKNIIITSPTLEPYATELARWKNSTGISSKVLNTTWVYRHYGGLDRQEQIRTCIKDFVATYGITYVTIFGDVDQVPVRYVYVPDGHDTYTPTDLYYADLDGTWDDNNDGLYADQRYDDVDGIPDVYVGRLPTSTTTYAKIIVDKIRGYQRQFDPSQNWTRRIILAAGTGHNGMTDTLGNATEVLKDYIANVASDKDIVKLYECYGNLSTGRMATQINDGALFVNFAGHGDSGVGLLSIGWLFYWVIPGLWWNGFGISDVQALTNGFKLPAVTTMSCSTAKFDDDDCIGEWFMMEPDGGSIAYFGATRIAWSYVNEWSPYGLMGEMDRRIYESFYEGYTKLGQMWGVPVTKYVQSHIWNYKYASEYDVKTFMEFALLGDPALDIGEPMSPATVYLDPPAVSTKFGKTFSINVSIADVVDLFGWEFQLFYPSEILNATRTQEGSFLKDIRNTFYTGVLNDNYNETHGEVLLTCILLGSGFGASGSGTLTSITFRAVGVGQSELGLNKTTLIDSNSFAIRHTTSNSQVSVQKLETKISFSLSPNPAHIGQVVTLQGSLRDEYGSPLEEVMVNVYSNEKLVTYLQTNSTGWFHGTGTPTSVGTYEIKVSFNGTETLKPSNYTQTLTMLSKINTLISFNLSPNPAIMGQTITLTGNLTEQNNTPIGYAPVEVHYSIDNGVTWVYAGTLQTNSTGWFKATGKLTVVGYYLIAVAYKGTLKYNPSHHIETLTIKAP